MMELPVTGGCLCGGVRYEITRQPFSHANCHCRSCQLATGGAYAPVMLVPTDGFSVSGPLSEYQSTGDSGNEVTRAFCSNCGTTIYARTTRVKTMRPVYAMTLDKPEAFAPELDAWVDFAQPSVCLDDRLPKYRRDLPAEAAGLPPPPRRRKK